MKIAIDYDGTITSNYVFYAQLCSMFSKSKHEIVIITSCNPNRVAFVKKDLKRSGITYHHFISRPKDVISGPLSLGIWKKKVLSCIRADLWFDNDIKNYTDLGIVFSDLQTHIVRA